MRRRWVGVLAALLVTSAAHATLTPSEEVLVKQYTAGAQLQNAQKVRALVARPDLSDAEAAAAMTAALGVPFTEARLVFLRELLFGNPGSAPSRNQMAQAVTRGLVARADAIYERSPTFDAASDVSAELLRIYGFFGGEIANAGHPALRAHDPQGGIDNTTYEACAKVLAEHLKHHAMLGPSTQLSSIATRIRAQAMLATYDMGGESPTRAIDGADRLGFDGVRRSVLIERGVLLLDSGKNPNALTLAQALVRRLRPSALQSVEALYFGEERHGLRAHGAILATKSAIDSNANADGFPVDEVDASPVHAPSVELAAQLALAAANTALASHGDLRVVVQRDVQSAGGDVHKLLGAATTPEGAAAAALGMLLVDAPRTLDLALARFLGGRPESVAQVSDALGVLAASAGPDAVQTLSLGKGEADGSSSPLAVTNVRLLPSGAVESFTLGGSRYDFTRGDTGLVTGVRHNGQPLAFGMLSSARIPVSGGQSWSGGGLTLSALTGSPLVGVVPGPRIRLVGQSELDVISMPSPGDELAFDADVRTDGAFAILFHARSGRDGLGMGLKITPVHDAPTKLNLVRVEPNGAEHSVAENAIPACEHVHVDIKAATMHAACMQHGVAIVRVAIEAPVPQHMIGGDVAVVFKKGVSLELGAPLLRRN